MIEYRKANIFDAETEAITNPCNCVGAMGAGLALQFKKRYPQMFKAYKDACNKKEVKVGIMWMWDTGVNPKWIVNFPTKDDWRKPSEYSYIVSGLSNLGMVISEKGIKSLALAALGCNLGGLEWLKVRDLIEAFHKTLPEDFKLVVYEPHE
jgi:O-acetyl-ADP-ribose deacetylase (regulator of RNase III)